MTNRFWKSAQTAYLANNRSWLPCTPKFYNDMLNVLPPVAFEFHPTLGQHFGCGECWDHTPDGHPIFLMFRSQPKCACRMATLPEFYAECRAALPPEWLALSPEIVTEACNRFCPGERETWQSGSMRQYVERKALESITANLVLIGDTWFAKEK